MLSSCSTICASPIPGIQRLKACAAGNRSVAVHAGERSASSRDSYSRSSAGSGSEGGRVSGSRSNGSSRGGYSRGGGSSRGGSRGGGHGNGGGRGSGTGTDRDYRSNSSRGGSSAVAYDSRGSASSRDRAPSTGASGSNSAGVARRTQQVEERRQRAAAERLEQQDVAADRPTSAKPRAAIAAAAAGAAAAAAAAANRTQVLDIDEILKDKAAVATMRLQLQDQLSVQHARAVSYDENAETAGDDEMLTDDDAVLGDADAGEDGTLDAADDDDGQELSDTSEEHPRRAELQPEFGTQAATSTQPQLRARSTSAGTTTGRSPIISSRFIVGTNAEPTVTLRDGKAWLFQDGSPMIYSGAVTRVMGRTKPAAGDAVMIESFEGQAFAWGVYNPTSMYQVRIMQMRSEYEADRSCLLDMPALIQRRVGQAVALRRALGLPSKATDTYRLLNSEGDRLSGAIADVVGNTVVVQSLAAWTERYRGVLTAAIQQETGLQHIVWRPSWSILQEEGVAQPAVEPAAPPAADSTAVAAADDSSETDSDVGDAVAAATDRQEQVVVIENGVRLYVTPAQGQKTGFYADQRDSRAFIASVAGGQDVLDLCCYSGGFALAAAAAGASSVTGVDSSAAAVQLAQASASLNGFGGTYGAKKVQVVFQRADVSDWMHDRLDDVKELREARRQAARKTTSASVEDLATVSSLQYDIVVLDPPKLAPSRASLVRAKTKYQRLNELALQLVRPGGLLMTCSCSGAMTQAGELPGVVLAAARHVGRQLTLIRTAAAGADHPLHPAYPEGHYLTNLTYLVL